MMVRNLPGKEDFLRVILSRKKPMYWKIMQRIYEKKITQITKVTNQLEIEISENNPAIFNVLRTVSDNDRLVLLHKFKKLFEKSKREVKLENTKWLLNLEQEKKQRLENKSSLLKADCDKAASTIQELTQIEKSVRLDKEIFNKNRVLPSSDKDESDDEETQESLDQKEADNFQILTSAVGWVPHRLTGREIVLHFQNKFKLELALKLDERPIVKNVFFGFVFPNEDKFLQELVRQIDAKQKFSNVRGHSELSEALRDLSVQLGRLSDLLKELSYLKQQFVHTYTSSIDQNCIIHITFSSVEAHQRFEVSFTVTSNYPFCKVGMSFQNQIGKVTEEMVRKVLATGMKGSKWRLLTKVCAKLKDLCKTPI